MCLALLLIGLMVFPAKAWEDEEIVGQVPRTLSVEGEGDVTAATGQTSLGGAAADGALWVSGADIAILPGGDLNRNLVPGTTTWGNLVASFTQESELVTVTVTPAELWERMEIGLSHLALDSETLTVDQEASAFDGFPQVAGFSYRGDTSPLPGERVLNIVLDSGEELDPEDDQTQLLMVTTREMLDGTYGYPVREDYTPLGVTQTEALAEWIASGELTSSYDGESRANIIGGTSTTLAGKYHLGFLAVVVIVIILVTARGEGRFMETMRNRWTSEPQEDGKSTLPR